MSHWVWVLIAMAGVVLSFSAVTPRWRRRAWFRRRGQAEAAADGHHAAEPVKALDSTTALRFPLSGCRLGQAVCLQCLEVDHCVLHRLRELGLTPGVELSVVQDSGGPLLVSVRGSRVALGRDLADNLYVIPAAEVDVLSAGAEAETGTTS